MSLTAATDMLPALQAMSSARGSGSASAAAADTASVTAELQQQTGGTYQHKARQNNSTALDMKLWHYAV